MIFCSRSPFNKVLLEELQSQFPKAILHHVVCDVAQADGRQKLVDFCREKAPIVHGLVNNVGTNIRKPILEQSPSEYDTMLRTNVESAYFLCRDFFPLLEKGSSSIVNVSSAAGVQSSGTGVAYGMSKAAVNQLSRTLACEWAAHGIRVNAVTPWMTLTPLLQQAQKPQDHSAVCEWTPLGRLAEPHEIADPITFLLLPAASYVTGQVWGVDGGLTAQGFAGPCLAAKTPLAE